MQLLESKISSVTASTLALLGRHTERPCFRLRLFLPSQIAFYCEDYVQQVEYLRSDKGKLKWHTDVRKNQMRPSAKLFKL